jgi:GTP-binding protein EngB required for normal cell division
MKLLFSKSNTVTMDANSHIKSQLNSLHIEKDILTKTISRLYQSDMDLSKIQRDRLLIRYQHQLGIVLAKIDKLNAANKHPDLGPLGEGLITLMDQKLSQLDKRLYEIASKINISNSLIEETKPKVKETKPKNEEKKIEQTLEIKKEIEKEITYSPVILSKPRTVEITTLTELPSKISNFPLIEQKPNDIQMEIIKDQIEIPQPKVDEKNEILQTSQSSFNLEKSETENGIKHETPIALENKPIQIIKLPEEENMEDEDDDLNRIKGEIMKTLSKLEQAEVE